MSDKAMSYSPRHRPKPEFKNLKFLNSGEEFADTLATFLNEELSATDQPESWEYDFLTRNIKDYDFLGRKIEEYTVFSTGGAELYGVRPSVFQEFLNLTGNENQVTLLRWCGDRGYADVEGFLSALGNTRIKSTVNDFEMALLESSFLGDLPAWMKDGSNPTFRQLMGELRDSPVKEEDLDFEDMDGPEFVPVVYRQVFASAIRAVFFAYQRPATSHLELPITTPARGVIYVGAKEFKIIRKGVQGVHGLISDTDRLFFFREWHALDSFAELLLSRAMFQAYESDASWEAFVQGTLLPYVRRLVRPDRAAVTGNQQAAGT
jgi:hypothetical protein